MKRLNVVTENNLEEAVRQEINRRAPDYEDGAKGFIDDLMYGGCQSGMVGSLIYYTDTVKFYKKYKAEIKELLKDAMNDSGLSIPELFGDKWDNSDPFCEEDGNQNLLAWFGFEETARHLADRAGIDL